MEDVGESFCPRSVNEEQTHNSSSNGHVIVRNGENGRHPKKKKEKEKPVKIQQRGKGVAELEKIRLAENEKNKGVVISPSPVITPLPAQKLSNRSDPAPLHPHFATHTRFTYNLSYENCFKYVKDHPYSNDGHQSEAHVNNITGYPNVCFATEENGRNHMTSENTRDFEKASTMSRHKNNGSDIPNFSRNMPMQLGNQHSYFPSPSMANRVASISSSDVMSFQTELPSNQSLYGNPRSLQPDEAEKILSAKRPYLFPTQDLPDPTECSKYYQFTSHSLGRSTSVGVQGIFPVNGNLTLREGLPCSMSTPNLQVIKETKTDCTKDLKLGPPSNMPLLPSLISKQALSYAHSHHAEQLKHDSTSYQVHAQGLNKRGYNVCTSHHNQEGTYPTILAAPSNVPNGHSTVFFEHNNGETEDKLDLSLKL